MNLKMISNIFRPRLPQECKIIQGLKVANVVVSLTSYPPRFSTLHKAVKSILQQSIKPKRLCLWIAENDIGILPDNVKRLTKYGLEILLTHDTKSFKKIIPCVLRDPDEVIVTADDDVYYPKDWLMTLYAHHLQSPDKVICHRARHITFAKNGSINPYSLWPYITEEMESLLVLPIGNGGILYPPNCFHRDIGREEIFLNICEFGDDIWLKVMSLKNSVSCKKIHHYKNNFRHIRHSQYITLNEENMEFRNDEQISNVFNNYNVISALNVCE